MKQSSKNEFICRVGKGAAHALDMALEKVAITVGQLLAGIACAEVIAERVRDERLKLGRGNTADRYWHPRIVLHGLRCIIPIAHASLV